MMRMLVMSMMRTSKGLLTVASKSDYGALGISVFTLHYEMVNYG